MRRYEGLEGIRPGALTEPVCTLGVFDGVHRGHRQILYDLKVWASAVGGEAVVLTFNEHPISVLRGIEVPAILSVENRLVELERHGVDACILLDFARIKDLEAKAFLQQVLLGRLGCHRLLLGFDSHLGRDRGGTPATLPVMGAEVGIEVRVSSPVLHRDGTKIGSSAIREAIVAGDLGGAANLLGRPFALRGRVVSGAGRGKGLGTATANLDVGGQVLPPNGVYLVRVFKGSETAAGVANLGVRPTFGSDGARTLEVHVPGWTGDMYGETVEVRLVRKLRDERRFANADALRSQIVADLEDLAQAVANGEV